MKELVIKIKLFFIDFVRILLLEANFFVRKLFVPNLPDLTTEGAIVVGTDGHAS